jgi:tetratricopeptide (TPR) repeat protein
MYGVTLHLIPSRIPPEAVEALAAEAKGRYAWMRWIVARFALAHKDWPRADGELGAVLRIYPWFLRVGFLLGESLIGQGRTDAALKVIAALKPKEPRERGIWLSWMGEIHLRLGHDAEALGYLDQACGHLGSSPRAHCWRGAARLRLGRLEEALPDLTESIRLDPADDEPYLWRAELYLRRGENARAAEDLDRALALRPGHVAALALRAVARGRSGDLRGMRSDVDELPQVLAGARSAGLGDEEILRRLDAFLSSEGDLLKAAPNYFPSEPPYSTVETRLRS